MDSYNFDWTQFLSVAYSGSYDELRRAVQSAFEGKSFSVIERKDIRAAKIDYFKAYINGHFFEVDRNRDTMFYVYGDWAYVNAPPPCVKEFIDGVESLLRDAGVLRLSVMATEFADSCGAEILHIRSSKEKWVSHLFNMSTDVIYHGVSTAANIVIDICTKESEAYEQNDNKTALLSCDYKGPHDELASKVSEAFGEYGISAIPHDGPVAESFAAHRLSRTFGFPGDSILDDMAGEEKADEPPFALRAFCNAIDRLAFEPQMESIRCFFSRPARNDDCADNHTHFDTGGLPAILGGFLNPESGYFNCYDCYVTDLVCGLIMPARYEHERFWNKTKTADMHWERGERDMAALIYRMNENALTPLQEKRLKIYRKNMNKPLPLDGDWLWDQGERDKAAEIYSQHKEKLSRLQEARLEYSTERQNLLREYRAMAKSS